MHDPKHTDIAEILSRRPHGPHSLIPSQRGIIRTRRNSLRRHRSRRQPLVSPWSLELAGKEVLSSKGRIPFCLLIPFEKNDLKVLKEVDEEYEGGSRVTSITYETSCGIARARLDAARISLVLLEKMVAQQSGIPENVLQESRRFVGASDPEGLREHLHAILTSGRPKPTDSKEAEVIDQEIDDLSTFDYNLEALLEYAEEFYNFPDVLYFYKMVVAINYSKAEDRIVLDIGNWVGSDEDEAADLIDSSRKGFATDLTNLRRIFSFVEESAESVAQALVTIESLREDDLIRKVLVPLLERLGFQAVSPTSFHGVGEAGQDIRPFYKVEEFGKRVYYAAQVKAVEIHANTARAHGNVQQLLLECKAALGKTFLDYTDNTVKRVDFVYCFLARGIKQEALSQLKDTLGDRDFRRLIIVEGPEIARQVCHLGMTVPSA
jgi:hypothetical protein